MNKYIKREIAIDFIKQNTPNFNGETTMECVERSLNFVPAVDVVEVVRCKDCKYGDFYIDNYRCENGAAPWYNNEYANIMQPNDFCSYGESKECNK